MAKKQFVEQAPEAQENVEAEVKEIAVRDPNEGLVKMTKGDEAIHVHPDNLHAHIEAGWKHA